MIFRHWIGDKMAKTGNKFIDDHIMIVRPMTVKEVKKASEKPRIYVTRIKSGWTRVMCITRVRIMVSA